MRILLLMLCLLIVACSVSYSPSELPPEPVPPEVVGLVVGPEVVSDDVNSELDDAVQPEEETEQEAEPKEELKDYGECWKDSDCGQDCADIYSVNVYKCDLKQHKCMPGKYEPYEVVNCKEKHGYQWRCKVGQCMKGN